MKLIYVGTILDTEGINKDNFPEQVKIVREGKKSLILNVSTMQEHEAINALDEAKLLLRRVLNAGTPDFLEKKINEFINRYSE